MEKGGKNEKGRVASHESEPSHPENHPAEMRVSESVAVE